jgi:hypothetical protein
MAPFNFIRINLVLPVLSTFNINNYFKKEKRQGKAPRTVGGFTDSDWLNIGNDMRKGILIYDKKRTAIGRR